MKNDSNSNYNLIDVQVGLKPVSENDFRDELVLFTMGARSKRARQLGVHLKLTTE